MEAPPRRHARTGRIRRIGAVPNHYAIGYTANGMSVWDVDDARIAEVGEAHRCAGLRHPLLNAARAILDWPYNLFAMVRAAITGPRSSVERDRCADRRRNFPGACRGRGVLFSAGF